MNILAIDTCMNACSAAVGKRLRSLVPSIATSFEPMVTGHAERIVPMIDELLETVSLSARDIDMIAVTCGPGTFAGTRIGISVARALALVSGAEIVSLTSLNLMAMNPSISGDAGTDLAVATDARRGEIYLQVIDRHSLAPAAEARVIKPEVIASHIEHRPVVFVGSGAEAALVHARGAGIPARAEALDLLPDAFDMLFLAFDLSPLQNDLTPLYLRAPDAKPPAPNPLLQALS